MRGRMRPSLQLKNDNGMDQAQGGQGSTLRGRLIVRDALFVTCRAMTCSRANATGISGSVKIGICSFRDVLPQPSV